MKLMITLFVICWGINICSSQSGKVVYGKEMIFPKDMYGSLEETDPEKYRDFMAFRRKLEEASRQISFKLEFSEGEAIFQPQEALNTKNMVHEMGVGPYGGSHYINRWTGEKLWEMNGYGQNFLIKMPETIWTLTSDRKVISGFKCIKATANRIVKNESGEREIAVEAWFTPDLPFSYGPVGYSGLPGLIVSLKLGKEHFYLKEIDLKKGRFEIERPTKGKEITYEEFQDIGRQLMSNMRNN